MLLLLVAPLLLAIAYGHVVWEECLQNEQVVSSAWFLAGIGLGFSYAYSLLWAVLEYIGLLGSKKIQPNKQCTTGDVLHAVWTQLKVHLCVVIVPLGLGTVSGVGLSQELPKQAPPGMMSSLLQLGLCVFYFDTVFYFVHREMHRPYLYKYVHYVHHSYSAPFAFVTNYAHPVELIIVSLISTSAPKLIGMHYYLELIWTMFAVAISVDAHGGYEIPLTLDKLPLLGSLFGGPVHHDIHHKYYTKNYAPFLTWLDRYMGTHRDAVTKPL